jgi:PAS domain S-box-containing protein
MELKPLGFKTKSVSGLLLKHMALVAFVSISVLGYLLISDEVSHYDEHANDARKTAIEARKILIKKQAQDALDFISFKQTQIESRVMSSIRSRTNEAHALATAIYEREKDTKTPEEIKGIIATALRSIRFNDGRGYYFGISLDGLMVFNPNEFGLEGTNQLELQNSTGSYVIRDLIDLVKSQDGGFYSYKWNKPGEGEQEFRKFSYVRRFAPFDWLIGTGEYLDDMAKEIQAEVLARLSQITFGNRGHILVVSQGAGELLTNTPSAYRMTKAVDPDGVQVLDKLKQVSQGSGDYLFFSQPPQDQQSALRRVCYTANVNQWGWSLVACVDLDDVESSLRAAYQGMQSSVVFNMIKIVGLLLALVTIAIYTSVRVASGISHELEAFKSFFRRAVQEPVEVDVDSLTFDDFKHLADSANSMVRKRQQLEAEHRKSEELYRGLVETSPDGVITYESDGVITFVNTAFVDIYGWSYEEVVGQMIGSLLSHDEAIVAKRAREEALLGNTKLINTKRHTKDGRLLDIQLAGVVLRDKEGVHTSSILIHRDITDLRQSQQDKQRLETQIYNSQKLESLGVLAGGIAHDFNNVLMPIMGYVELALEDVPQGSQVSHNLECVMTAAERARDLVSQILVFSRQDEDATFPTHLTSMVKETTQLLRASLPASIQIKAELDASEDLILANPSFIHQILMNLATNAGHAMESTGGTLTIGMKNIDEGDISPEDDVCPSSTGQYVSLTIADTGDGMPPEVLDRIFDPYFTTKGIGEGSGMGLSVVHGLVTKLGGAVKVQSSMAQGTTFSITFPLVAEEALIEGGDSDSGNIAGTERVLFVDDEELVSHFWGEALRRLGYSVTSVTSSEAALQLFMEDPEAFDVVVTDQTMPDMTGLTLASKMLDRRSDMPVILYTGYSKLVDKDTAISAGISEFLMKPLSVKKMGQSIRSVLKERVM